MEVVYIYGQGKPLSDGVVQTKTWRVKRSFEWCVSSRPAYSKFLIIEVGLECSDWLAWQSEFSWLFWILLIVHCGHHKFIMKPTCPVFCFSLASFSWTGVGMDKLDSWVHSELVGLFLFLFLFECDGEERLGIGGSAEECNEVCLWINLKDLTWIRMKCRQEGLYRWRVSSRVSELTSWRGKDYQIWESLF